MALQTFLIHGIEKVDGGFRLHVEKDSLITAKVDFDRKGGQAIPMWLIDVPRFRLTQGNLYVGEFEVSDEEARGVWLRRCNSITIDTAPDGKSDAVWGFGTDTGEFVPGPAYND